MYKCPEADQIRANAARQGIIHPIETYEAMLELDKTLLEDHIYTCPVCRERLTKGTNWELRRLISMEGSGLFRT